MPYGEFSQYREVFRELSTDDPVERMFDRQPPYSRAGR